MNYHLTLKVIYKNLTKGPGHDLIGKGYVACVSRSVLTPEHTYGSKYATLRSC